MVTILEDLKQQGASHGADAAGIAAVPPPTVSRWASGKASPHPTMRPVIADLRPVVDRLAEHYTPEEVRRWMYAGHHRLAGKRPIDLIQEGRAEEVLAVIESPGLGGGV